MKKVIALAVVIIAALLFAKFYQLKIVGFLENSTYALTDNLLTQNLLSEEIPPEKTVVEPLKAESTTPLYELGGNLYLGEQKSKLNHAYPLFVNEATAVMNINNSAKLITEDFQSVKTYYGLYVSDGISFNADKERADAEEFILLELANKMYINAKQMDVHTICGDVQIPMNGVLNFQEDSIRYYTLREGRFHYGKITRLDEQAWVCFADRKYPYRDFLKNLGKLNERTNRDKITKPDAPLPENQKLKEPEKQKIPPEEGSGQEGSPLEVKPGRSSDSRPASFRKPRVAMSDFQVNHQEKTAQTILSISDPAGVLTGIMQVVILDTNGKTQRWTFTDYAEAQQGVIQPVVTFTGLESGMTYSAYGTYTYLDANGQMQTQVFGTGIFRVEELPIFFFDFLREEPKAEQEFKFIKPQISCAPFVADIYDLHSTLTIQERGTLIAGGIRFEVYRDERLFMRKTVSESGEFTIGPLPPATEYKVIGSLTYLNEYKLKVEEIFLEQTISTLSLAKLAPMSLEFANGEIFYDRIQLVELAFADDPADSAQKIGFSTIPYVAKIAVQIENSAYSLKVAQINALREGGRTKYETPAVLRSNRVYPYQIICYDRFGNELPLTEPAVGETHTCKAPPKAIIRLTGNEVANTEITVAIENKDQVQTQNYRIALYDMEDNLVPTIVKTGDGASSDSATHHDLPENGGKIVFANLATGDCFTAVVYSDYDLDNGEGIQENMEIGRIRFTTLPISALGYAIFNTEIVELTDTGALLSINLDQNRTNQSLIYLLDQVTALISTADGEAIGSFTLTEEELQQLAAGEPFQIELEELSSATEYELTLTAGVEQGSVIYEIKTSNNLKQFRTLKKEPEVEIPSYFTVSNSIELYDVLINDPDEAILSKVNLLVSDSYGRIVGTSILDANTLYETIAFPKLIENEMYTFTFVATEFNKGYDYTTYKTLYQLKPTYQIINENQLMGKIGLQGLDEIAGDKVHFQARLRVQISDEKRLLFEEPHYTVKVFKEEAEVESLVYEIEPAGSMTVDELFSYNVEKMSEYRLELWAKVREHEFKLDETSFTTEKVIIGLKTIQDFNQIKTNRTGKYIVLNDIELTSGPILGWEQYFNGELDFQGYTWQNSKGTYLFSHLGKNGIIKNMVLDLTIPHNDPFRYRGFIVYVSQGRMENIMVNVKGCTEFLHNDWGIFCRSAGTTSVIENFVVNLESPLYIWTNFACVVPYNSGMVRNGYVYGADLELPDIEVEGGYSASIFGGVVGRNETAGQVENVFNLVNIRTGTLVAPSKDSFGLIAGVNNGRLKGAFTTGEVYFGGENDLKFGPAVGSQGGMLQTTAYYISEGSTYTNTYNTKVTKETLYDPLWHRAVLGGMFETEEPVLLGYYPQLKMPDCMPAQPYLPLPELDVANAVNLASVMVEEQYEDYAIARFTFNNPYGYTIKSVGVEYLDATIIEDSQVDKDDLSRVLVRLDNPTNFYSTYSVQYFGYGLSAHSSTILHTYQKGERLINTEFFKPIRTIEDWTSIEDRREQNYRLKEDLDFLNIPAQLIRIGEKDGDQFIGKLDGGIYDKVGKLTGLHTIRNLDLSVGLGGVIANLKGVVSNLRVERLILENPTDGYVGFVRRTQSGALVDNVHLSNVRVQGNSMVGGIAGQCNYAVLQNCSVNSILVREGSTVITAGGLAGQGLYSIIKNCYVYGLNVLLEKAKTSSGVGGIIGYTDNSEIENCYAVGKIQTTVQNVGGLVGRAGGGNMICKMWSDVDIASVVDFIGGMVGFYGGNASGIVPANTLVLGDLYSSVTTAANVRRVMGNRADMENGYAWDGQLINGEIPQEEEEGTTPANDGAVLLSGELLRDPQTYLKRIELGDYFDYDKVENGRLPQLKDTTGKLLPYQTEHSLDESPLIEVTDVTAELVGNKYQIQIGLTHQPGLQVEDAVFDYLNVETEIAGGENTTTLLCTLVGQPTRCLDSYQLKGIKYNGGKLYSVLSQVCFETPFYNDIPDVATWQAVMAERKDNFENFRITGNLDFGNRSDLIYNANVNRIVGNLGAGGEYTVIRNIKINFPETGQSFINTVNAGVNNLRFENIELTNTKAGGSNVGVIGNCFGKIEKVAFKNIEIKGLSASRVGCIGYIMGGITDASVENVKIGTTGEYAGALVGQAYIATLSGINGQTIEVSGKNYVGSLAGYVYGDISYSTAENVFVTGTGNYVGGIAGYATPIIGGDIITNEQLSVKNANIKGANYVGGIVGHGKLRNNDNWSTFSLAEESIIIGTGGYIGGLMGTPADRNRNGLVRNCKIFGGYNVGGIMGNSAGAWKFFVLDSTISTIYDPKYGVLTESAVPEPPNSTHNTNIGGVSARVTMGSNINMSGAVNCTIGAQGADNVGGVYGYCSQDSNTFFCLDSTVYGKNNIGGLVGYHRACPVYNCQSNAKVIATGENAGGMSGYMYINRDLDGTRVPRLVGNYYVGEVTAADYAGGLVGRTSAELSGDNSRLVVAAKVTTDGDNGNLIGNLVGGSFAYLRIYDGSTLSVGNGGENPTPPMKASEIYASAPQSSGGMQLVTTAQLKIQTTYTTGLGSYFSTGYRNYSGLSKNYMPYLRYGNDSATMPYQEGKDKTGEYNAPNSYLGGIPIPDWSSAPATAPLMAPMMMPLSQELPVPDFYASGADKLNIEFAQVDENFRFAVWANERELFEQQIDKRVYTLNYDYVTPLTVIVTDGFHGRQYEVDPLLLRRNVLTWNTDYYWRTDLGVQSGKAGLLAGNFIHLYTGQGLTAAGKLCDLADGTVIREAVEIALCEEARPLYSFNYADYGIKTYKNFSESTRGGETVTRELQLLVKNGRLAALDPLLPVVYDGVLVDSVGEAEYLTVLGTDGMLVDLKEHICLPQDFKNRKIVQMTQNLHCTAPYVLVRYENGSVVAFNYLTGEVLSVETVKSDLSLFEYAKEFFQARLNSVMSDLSDGYLQITQLQEKLSVLPISDTLSPGEKTGGEGAEGKNADGVETEGEKAGESADDADTSDEQETEDGRETETSADQEDAVGKEIADGQGTGEDKTTETERGKTPPTKKPTVKPATGTEGEKTQAGETRTEPVGDLAKPEPLVRCYIPVYDVETGQYLLYEEKNLLEASETALTPVNKELKIAEVTVKGSSRTQKAKHNLEDKNGIYLLSLIAVSILALLLYILLKKRRL